MLSCSFPPFDSPSNLHPLQAPAHSANRSVSPSSSKFAVATHEGMVAVWDVRSRQPMKMFTTDRNRAPPGGAGGMARSGNRATGAASGWLYKDSWECVIRCQDVVRCHTNSISRYDGSNQSYMLRRWISVERRTISVS